MDVQSSQLDAVTANTDATWKIHIRYRPCPNDEQVDEKPKEQGNGSNGE